MEQLVYSGNVVNLPAQNVSTYVYLFLENRKKNSSNTYISYKNYIHEFFMFQFNKEVSELNWDDLYTLSKINIYQYQNYLTQKNNGNNTINQKTMALRKMWKFLSDEKEKINPVIFNVEKLSVDKNNPNGYGSFTSEEIEKLIEFSKTHKRNGEIKSLFIETSYVTAIRKDCLLNMTYQNMHHETDTLSKKSVYVFKYHDKGKDEITAISDSLAKRILNLKNIGNSNIIFSISDESLSSLIDDFCRVNRISKSRRLSVHSIKKASGDAIHQMFNDITLTAKHLHHSNIQTAYKNYLGKNANLINQPSYYAFDEKLNIDEILNMDNDSIRQLLQSVSKDMVVQLIRQKRKMFK